MNEEDIQRYEKNLKEHEKDCAGMVACCNIAEAVRPLLDEVRRLQKKEDVPAQFEHQECVYCRGGFDPYDRMPNARDHEKCTGHCPGHYNGVDNTVECKGPCGCKCRTPLSPNELMDIREFIERLRR